MATTPGAGTPVAQRTADGRLAISNSSCHIPQMPVTSSMMERADQRDGRRAHQARPTF